ncbi:MAG: 4-(cytidine 5'-diphospho)-2-C-methyl-D-erythritol kinase [Longimicrobiales bacterium]|nr:4-(cytidine 5'-diphospho)-2-C-methyl-D-erythritol kinase [Longimicrobiales bacterium]
MLKLHAPAKVNLFLRVLAQEKSGFHQLETLFTSLEFGDTLSMEAAPSGITLETDGPPMGPLEENLVYRAAKGFLEEGGVEGGVRIHLKKGIPLAAGLGGGSSDAGATLRGLRALFPGALGEEELLRLAGALGSDVPFFLSPSPLTLAWGRGDRLLPLPPLPPAPVLLALPPIEVRTPVAYGLLAREREDDPQGHSPGFLSPETFSSWEKVGEQAENDFEGPVFREYPLLGRIRGALRGSRPILSLLSGSGAALFGLYPDQSTAAVAKADLSARFPDTRFVLTRTGSLSRDL